MNNNIYLKLFLFFVGIEVIILGISFKNLSLIILGLLNTLVILFMFFNFSFSNIILKFKQSIFIRKDNSKQKKDLKNYVILKSKMLNYLEVFIDSLKYFYLKGGFVLSIVILILAILDKILFHKFGLNLLYSAIFFVLGLIVLYENIKRGEIYIGNRLLTSKDVVFLLSLVLAVVFFVFLNKFPFYEKFFYSLLLGFAFYVITIFSLNYEKFNLKFFSKYSVVVYLGVLLLSFLIYAYKKIPEVKNIFTVKQIVYKEKPVYKEKIIYKTKNATITYFAPNGKKYEIVVLSTGVYFTGYNNVRKYFPSFEAAREIIDKYNQPENLPLLLSKSDYKKDKVDNTFLPKGSVDTDTTNIINIFSNLLGDEESTNNTNNEKYLTYYDIIPWLIKKYNLDMPYKPDIYFKYISKTDKNYSYFKTAYYLKMFGKNSNPNLKVRCRNFAVLLGLAEGWKLNYNKKNVFNVFYKEAIKRGYKFNKCCKSQYDILTERKKVCILNKNF